MAYTAYITKIKELRNHSNADRLQIATVFGNDVVVGLDLSLDDLIIYFPSDGQLSEKYAKENKLTRSEEGYLDDNKRNVKAIKLRGERSDGLIMPVSSLDKFGDTSELKEGDALTVFGGELICQKYVPKSKEPRPHPQNKGKKNKPKDFFPYFERHVDTEQLAYNLNKFKEGDLVYLTLKMHGTSGRISNSIKKKTPNFFQKLFNLKTNKSYEIVSGTRKVVLDGFDGGYYGSNEFRKKYHDFFSDKLPKGMSVYFEIVGYMDNERLIMPECNNKKLKDKEFVKQYGDTTRFTYGCEEGQNDIYVYRMTMTNEDGEVVEIPWEQVKIYCEKFGVKHVPELDKFIFTSEEDLLNRVRKYEDGIDPIGKNHIREGVIARIEGKEKFTALKQKGFSFKILEGIIKDEGILDVEEQESSRQED